MKSINHTSRLAVFAIAVLVCGLLVASEAAGQTEFRFIAQDLEGKNAIWLPSVVVIATPTDIAGGLVFEVENPTNTEHAFAVHGLFELIAATDKAIVESDPTSYVLKPIRIMVAPKETKRIRVSTGQLEGNRSAGQRFKLFCPIHTRFHLNGAIWVTAG